jgi:hypothetical protein
MTLRIWAIKPTELKQLPRERLLLLGARCAMRVEPWRPADTETAWSRGLEYVVASAFSESDPGAGATLRRTLSDWGAIACNAMSSVDQALGQCMNYAMQTLARAIDATSVDFGAPMKKVIVEVAKLSASIAAVLAHAGRVKVPPGADPVDVACVAMWDAIRADIPVLADGASDFKNAEDRVQALRDCSALWVGGVPSWALRFLR